MRTFGVGMLLETRFINQKIAKIMEKYQVNVTEKISGETTAWISRYQENGYVGVLVDTTYADGADTTDWCVFAGSKKECENYISENYNN